MCLADIYGKSAGFNATTATAQAAANGYGKLSERDLWEIFEKAIC